MKIKLNKTLNKKLRFEGFTLIEILLVLVIMSSIILLVVGFSQQKLDEVRRDRAALQFQQILNAGLAYYVSKGAWPANGVINGSHQLVQNGYLPAPATGTMTDPWGNAYYTVTTSTSTTTGAFYAYSSWNSVSPSLRVQMTTVAGRLPLAFTWNALTFTPPTTPPVTPDPCTGTSCSLVAMTNVPGQSLSTARAVNFVGVYKSSSCVPAPICPSGMRPRIYVAPSQVSGTMDASGRVHPISSFYAFARGGSVGSGDPVAYNAVLDCAAYDTPSTWPCTQNADPNVPAWPETPNTKYWRVCLSIVTASRFAQAPGGGYQGVVPNDSSYTGINSGSIIAMTRCEANDGAEVPHGNVFPFWQPNKDYHQ